MDRSTLYPEPAQSTLFTCMQSCWSRPDAPLVIPSAARDLLLLRRGFDPGLPFNPKAEEAERILGFFILPSRDVKTFKIRKSARSFSLSLRCNTRLSWRLSPFLCPPPGSNPLMRFRCIQRSSLCRRPTLRLPFSPPHRPSRPCPLSLSSRLCQLFRCHRRLPLHPCRWNARRLPSLL